MLYGVSSGQIDLKWKRCRPKVDVMKNRIARRMTELGDMTCQRIRFSSSLESAQGEGLEIFSL